MTSERTRPGPKLELYPYQQEGRALLRANPGGVACFDEPGLGKTPQSLTALQGEPCVVVTLSGVKDKWRAEFRRWAPGYAVRVCRTLRSFRWPRPRQAVILNYEILPPAEREVKRLASRIAKLATDKSDKARKDSQVYAARRKKYEALRNRLTKPYKGTRIIADEAHRLKSGKARCTMRFWEMAALCVQSSGGVWPLTGTPLINRKEELWMVLQCAGLGVRAFGTYRNFEEDWKVPGVVAGKLRSVSIRRRRVDVLPQLPPVMRETRLVPIGDELRRDMDRLVAALRARGINLATASLEQIREAIERAEVKAIDMRVSAALAQAKVPAMLEFVAEVEENEQPLVIACMHRGPVDLMSRKRGWGRISGDESAAEKDRVAQDFQRGALQGVALTYRAGGAGIDLYRAWRGLSIDLPWTPADVDQFEGRLNRIGQQAKGLLFTRLVADHPLEIRKEELIARKQGEIDKSVELSSVGQRLPAPRETL